MLNSLEQLPRDLRISINNFAFEASKWSQFRNLEEYLFKHSEPNQNNKRYCAYSIGLSIARYMNLPENQELLLKQAIITHDLGLLVLNETFFTTDQERTFFSQFFPEIGYFVLSRIVDNTKYLHPYVPPVVLSQDEIVFGTGPVSSRIFANPTHKNKQIQGAALLLSTCKHTAQAVIQSNSKQSAIIRIDEIELSDSFYLLKDRFEQQVGYDIIGLMVSHPKEFGLNMFQLDMSGLYPTFNIM